MPKGQSPPHMSHQVDMGRVSDIDSIKLMTLGISNEVAELRQSMMSLEANSKDKDVEIGRLQKRLEKQIKTQFASVNQEIHTMQQL